MKPSVLVMGYPSNPTAETVDLAFYERLVAWAKEQGAHIERFSFAEQPDEFARNAVVEDFVERSGYDALPLALVDGELAVAGRHPTRNELARWAGLAQPVAAGGCCSGGHCG